VRFQIKDLFNPGADLQRGQIAVLACLLALSAILSESSHYFAWWPAKRVLAPILGILIVAATLARIIIALFNRLLLVIRESTAARRNDLFLIAFTYASVIVGFGVVYLLLESAVGKEVFAFSRFPTKIRLIDNLYMSGITIATVGYGDIVPAFWFTKLLVVFESLIGIWLTATVLGFFIGSLLSFQQQDQQRKWYAGIQRIYFEALNEYSEAISSIDLTQNLADLKAKTLTTRQAVLKTIAILVQAQYAPAPSAKVCANWMRLYVGAETPRKYLDMAEPYTHPQLRGQMQTVWGILVLREWGEQPEGMPGSEELALPVYDPQDLDQIHKQLPGAPAAVAGQTGYYIVSDTETIDLTNQDADVRTRMEQYFQLQSARLRSFASVRIDDAGATLGVVNIQSDEPDLCGTTEYVQSIIVDMIKPFARYLADLVAYDEAKEKEEQSK
jgi:hypothetical protein